MSATVRQWVNPWPGPKPYRVTDGQVFFGRREEIDEVRSLMQSERLAVLSGSSGAGKTSLLRAGVIFTLNRDREAAKKNPARAPVWPVLLLHDWGVHQDQRLGNLFRERLRSAGTDLPNSDEREKVLGALQPITGETSFFDDIVQICNVLGGIYLIFDQFEEVIRAREGFAQQAVKFFRDIHRYERRARVLISLRSEYHTELRELESSVNGLYGRTYFLSKMKAATVQEAIVRSGEAAAVALHPEVVVTLLTWLRSMAASSIKQSDMDVISQEHDDDQAVDLLTLQTVLHELFRYAQAQPKTDRNGNLVIDIQVLADYRGKRSLEDLIGGALERWIDDRVSERVKDRPSEAFGWLGLPEETVVKVTKRIAARMAPFLSSGGYKVAAAELDLWYSSLRTELKWIKPELENIEREKWRPYGSPPRLDRHALKLSAATDETAKAVLSGEARRRGWSPADTADHLYAAFVETLHRLWAGNVLKPVRDHNDLVWELVHDGLGRPLNSWAERQLSTWDDNVAAFTARGGESVWIAPDQKMEHEVQEVCWQGCWVGSTRPVILDDVTFSSCELRGTVFENCIFRGGGFTRCGLDGVLFKNCHFEQGKGGRPFKISECKTNNITLLSSPNSHYSTTVSAMAFEDCAISQLRFSGVRLAGSVCFGQGVDLFLAHFEGTQGAPSGQLVFDNGCVLESCAWDESTRAHLILRDCRLISSGLQRETRL